MSILSLMALNSYQGALLFMEHNFFSPQRLEELARSAVLSGTNRETLIEAATDAQKQGFLSYVLREPSYRYGIYPSAPDDRDPVIHVKDVTGQSMTILGRRSILTERAEDLPPDQYHPLLHPKLLREREDIDTRGIRIEDIEAIIGGQPIVDARDTLINDLNSVARAISHDAFCNVLRLNETAAIKAMIEAGLVDVNAKVPGIDHNPTSYLVIAEHRPESVKTLLEFGANPVTLIKTHARELSLASAQQESLHHAFQAFAAQPAYHTRTFDSLHTPLTYPFRARRVPLLVAAAAMGNTAFITIAAEYADRLAINPNVLLAGQITPLDAAIIYRGNSNSRTPDSTLRALQFFPGLNDDRPLLKSSLYRAVMASDPVAVKAALEAVDPMIRGPKGEGILDIAADVYLQAREQNRLSFSLPSLAKHLVDAGFRLFGEESLEAKRIRLSNEVVELIQNDARIVGRPICQVAEANSSYATFVRQQEHRTALENMRSAANRAALMAPYPGV